MTTRIITTYLTLIISFSTVGQVDSTSNKIDSSAASIVYKNIDDLKRPNIIIDNFSQLQENCKKIQLDTEINLNFTPFVSDNKNEFFFTKKFIENFLFHLPLKNLLIGKDEENSWAGYDKFYNEYVSYDTIDNKEVISTSPPISLVNDKNINIYLLEYRYLLIFDSMNNYIGGFDAISGMGNSHGATRINTLVYPDFKFEIFIDDWNENGNPHGTVIKNIYVISKKNKLIRTFYKSKKSSS